MGDWSGPFLLATVLLAVAGVAKTVDPAMTVGALRGHGLRVPGAMVRSIGALEAALAIAAAATGAEALAYGVAVSYLAFAVFVVITLVRRLPVGTCGCFGKADAPPSWIHVVVDVGAAASALAVAVHPGAGGRGLAVVLDRQPLGGFPFLLLIGAGVYAAFIALTVVPQFTAGRRVR